MIIKYLDQIFKSIKIYSDSEYFMILLEINPALCICHKTKDHKVQNYYENLKNGAIFPPIEVVLYQGKYFVKDGNHRTQAHILANEKIWAYVFDYADYPNLHLIGSRITWKI